MRKGLLIGTALLWLTACGTEEAEPTVIEDVQAQETSEQSIWDDYIFMYEPATLNDITYTITGVEAAQEMAGYTSNGGMYLAVKVHVENNSKEPLKLRNSMFKVFSNEAYYEHDTTVSTYYDDGFSFEKINPGMSIEASVVYEVPNAVVESPTMMEIKPNQLKDETANIVLAERP